MFDPKKEFLKILREVQKIQKKYYKYTINVETYFDKLSENCPFVSIWVNIDNVYKFLSYDFYVSSEDDLKSRKTKKNCRRNRIGKKKKKKFNQ